MEIIVFLFNFWPIFILILFILIIVIIILIILGIHNTARDHKDHKAEVQARQPKEHYKDEQWLKMQYYDRSRSIQEIANHENVSMMQIEEAIKKLDLPKEESLEL